MIQISFTALHGDDYVLQIGAAEQDADPTVVDGTRDVFTTTEEDDTDVFMPVRCTSGTIRFYNAGNAWGTLADISDEHKPVTLLSNGSPVWSGYINKGYVGTRKLYGYNEECEICVQCPLSELDTVNYEPTKNTMMTLGSIVSDILTYPFGNDGDTFNVTLPSGTDAGMVLGLYVYSGFFYKNFENDDGSTAYVPKYTRKEALAEVLKMACCTARWTGTSVEIKEMKVVSSSSDTLSPNPADTDSSETAIVPFKSVRVTANANENDVAIQWPTKAIQNWVSDNKMQSGWNLTVRLGTTMLKPINVLYGDFGSSWSGSDEWRNITDDEYDYTPWSGQNETRIAAYEDRSGKDVGSANNRAPSVWLNQCSVQISEFDVGITQVNTTIFCIKTKNAFFIQDAILCIQMRLTENFYEKNFSGVVKLSVKVGSYFWESATNSWTTQPSNAFFDAEFENGQLKRTQDLNPYFDSYDGYGIPVDRVLSGEVQVTVDASNFSSDLICIDSLEVSAVRHVANSKERNLFTANGTKGSGDDDVELAFCSQRRAVNADNFLFAPLGNEYEVVPYLQTDYGDIKPEEWVAKRRATLTTSDTKARSVILLRQIGDIEPGQYAFNGKVYDTLSINHDWAENITEAHLIEIS